MATADSMARAAEAKRAAAAKKKRDALVKKGTTPKMSADRLSSAKTTNVQAGGGSKDRAVRAKQNTGVADKTVRLGAKGKAYNIYDAKTATWKKTTATGASKTTSKPENATFGGSRKPNPKDPGPGTVGIKNPKDGSLYRFGPPNNQETYRWNAKTKKFVKSK